MSITQISGHSAISFAEPMHKGKRQQPTDIMPQSSGDSVSLSLEARRLSEIFLAKLDEERNAMWEKTNQQNEQNESQRSCATPFLAPSSKDSQASSDDKENTNDIAGAASTGTSASGISSDPEAQVKDLEERIKKLQQQIMAVAESDLPEDTKEAKISGLQTQISQLTQELNTAKQAIAQSKSTKAA